MQMTASDGSFHKIPTFPILRKVYRTRAGFICGICRSIYDSRLVANNCLNVCWFELQTLYPVIRKKSALKGTIYRCQHCARDYDHEPAALQCAEICSKSRVKRHIQEQLLNGLPLDTRRHVSFRLICHTNSQIESKNKKEQPKKFKSNN